MLAKLPTILTFIRIGITPIFIYYFVQDSYSTKVISTILFFLASFTDWLDGFLARKLNQITRFGQFLDPIADKFLVLSAFYVLYHEGYLYLWMVMVIIVRDVVITALRLYALQRGKAIITSSFAKWKTMFQMGYLFTLIVYLLFPEAPSIKLTHTISDWLLWSNILGSVIVALTAVSGFHYLYYNRRHIFEIFKRLTYFWTK